MIYGAAKAAVNHLTVCAAMQLGEKNVRCNSISPGGIATGIFAKALGVEHDKADSFAEAAAKNMASLQPIPRAGRTDDIAKAAVFLASDEFDLHQRPRPGGRWRRGRRPAVDAAPAGRAGDAPGVRCLPKAKAALALAGLLAGCLQAAGRSGLSAGLAAAALQHAAGRAAGHADRARHADQARPAPAGGGGGGGVANG